MSIEETNSGSVSARVHVTEVPSLLHEALSYARRGIPVFPCSTLNKEPLVGSDRDADGHKIDKTGGFYKASTDENQIRAWWSQFPNAMIGLRMGEASGIWAIDPDIPKTPLGADGVLNWDRLQQEHGYAPATRVHRTPTGGLHLLFKWRSDKPVTTREGKLRGLGINVRGNGGYIIAPPSQNAGGARYEVYDASEIADAPDWLYDLILDSDESRQAPSDESWALPHHDDGQSGSRQRYAEAVMHNACTRLSQMGPNSGRNIELNRTAFLLGKLVADGSLREGAVVRALNRACESNGLMQDRTSGGPMGVKNTIRSGLSNGRLHPWEWKDWQTNYRQAAECGITEPASEIEPAPPLGEWDAGLDDSVPPPRGWLLGNIFCRQFASSLLADGAVGKSSLRYVQLLSLATGRPLTGEHVFQRSRVLIVSLEDGATELKRRLLAARLHHGIELKDVEGWLYLAAPGLDSGKLLEIDSKGRLVMGGLAERITEVIVKRQIDIVSLDPLIKLHSVGENDNNAMDRVAQILTELAIKHDIAVDVPHHMAKGPSDPGNAKRGRGASATKDAFRLVYTLTPMNSDEAKEFGLSDAERRYLVRMDSGKVNIAPPTESATWFRLVGIRIGNGTERYPNGDEVQTVERWTPPPIFADVSIPTINEILNDIEKGLPNGNRYSSAVAAKDRAAWRVVVKHVPEKAEAAARKMISSWLASGLLFVDEYDNPDTRKPVKGLWVNNSKRP